MLNPVFRFEVISVNNPIVILFPLALNCSDWSSEYDKKSEGKMLKLSL